MYHGHYDIIKAIKLFESEGLVVIYIVNSRLADYPSGIEISEQLRHKMFTEAGHEVIFLFTEMTQIKSIQDYFEDLGFSGKYIELFHFFTNRIPKRMTNRELAFVDNHYELSFYEDTLFYKEIYEGTLDYLNVVQRIFYDENGEERLIQYVDRYNFSYDFNGIHYKNHHDLVVNFYNAIGMNDGDVVFFDRIESLVLPFLSTIAYRKNIKTYINVMSEHMVDGEWNPGYKLLPFLANKITGIVVQTELQKELLYESLKNENVIANNLFVAQMNCSPDIHSMSTNSNRSGFMTASRLATEKNLPMMIEKVAQAHAKDDTITLDIYGGGEDVRGLLERMIEDKPYIQLKGYLPSKDIPYYKYEAFVTTSFGEGFGNTLLESLSQGTPVIGWNRRYGVPAIVEDDVSGRLFDEPDELVELFLEKNWSQYREGAIKGAKKYDFSVVQKRWLELL
ncbi:MULTISPECIES: glycosyltransferase [unclassified Facklamia]|uniref:glycosyltransferase n=1 Tax=Aerococcaceae TaxID=186827 RepID=UPI0013BC16AC|nr:MULTISPECIES: glycosyltransferase [unclassified Facklamia]NEW64418.1 glycosyltransferase [Facklamia sp. 252]NEW68499.1 glycosyltransferase [Facklamia sp. 253]QQD64877.1 glycosyltransferase [Aerococcaceae bacterium zg-252]